jgi:hypothetical protein
MKPWHRTAHVTGGRKNVVMAALCFAAMTTMAFALGGCTLKLPLRGRPTLTLIPTLDLIIPPTATATLSPTPEPDTLTPSPTQTFRPSPSATITITPWVPDTATPGPSPTISRTPTFTRTPTITRTPTRTRTVTLTPTITNTPTPPVPVVNIIRPGLLSRVLSPIQMELNLTVGEDGKVAIELVGEDGRVISRQIKDYGMEEAGKRIYLVPEMPFEIAAAAETARLQVITQDQFGRLQGIASVDIILLAVGRNEINPPAIIEEPYLIRQPKPESEISGGKLVINGLARPVNNSPLFIDLVTEDNVVISTKQVNVEPPTGPLSHTPFTVEIPYHVEGPTPVRLMVRQAGSRLPGIVALTSRVVTLLP